MKRLFVLFLFSTFLFSCQTRVVSQQKPIQANSLEVYQRYTIQTADAKTIKMQVLRQDETSITGKNKAGEEIVLMKSDIREAKKLDLFSSIAIGLAAVAAVIFVPI